MQTGDFLLLFNFDEHFVYGVWRASTNGGNYEPTAWLGKFRNQVHIQQIGNEITRTSQNQIQAIVGAPLVGKIYEGAQAEGLLQHFHPARSQQETRQRPQTENISTSSQRASQRTKEDHFLLPGEFICADGDRVSSKDERIIDDWLSRHSVKHSYEPKIQIGGHNLVPDFVIYSRSDTPVYIEYWGITNNQEYDQKRREKTRLYLQKGINLIQIVPENIKVIDYVLEKELERWDVPNRKPGILNFLLQFLRRIFSASRRPR